METIELTAQPRDAGVRLDRFVAENSGLSRAAAQRLIEEGQVLLNGTLPAKSAQLSAGDLLAITIPPPRETLPQPEDIPLPVVYEDDWLLVVDKPKGMVVHPAAGSPRGTLVNALLHHCKGSLSGIGGEVRPGIVHRIDKDTSGLLVVAKNDVAHQGLSEQFAQHSIKRVYHAVVYGHLRDGVGTVDAPIGRSKTDRKKMAVTDSHSKPAVTHYRVVAEYPGFSQLELELETGRTHQIRVHMAQLGHPLAGDGVYGPRRVIKQLRGQCLHAGTLGFVHPQTGQPLCFESPLPPYFTSFIAMLQQAGQEDIRQ